MKMIVPVIAEGVRSTWKLSAEFLEELYGVVTVQSDACARREESRHCFFCSGLIRNEGDDVLFKFGHHFAIVLSPVSP